MGKQHNRRIFAGFYKRYDNKYIYVVAVVPDVDTGSQVVIFHEGIDWSNVNKVDRKKERTK